MVKFGLVLIYILKVYRKKPSSFFFCFFFVFEKKICSVHYLHFSFEKHVLSQVLKDFSLENVETTSSTFLLKFPVRSINLELVIIGVVFLHYT